MISDFKCEYSFTCIDSLLIRVTNECISVKNCKLVLFISLLLLTYLIIKKREKEERIRVSADEELKIVIS